MSKTHDKITTRSKIIAEGTKLFKEKGFHSVTIQDICRQVGITRGTFYYYFNSKEELLNNYFEDMDSISMEELASVFESDSYIEHFYALFELYLNRTIAAGPKLMAQILHQASLSEDPMFHPSHIAQRKIYISLIEQAQASGEIENMSPAEDLVDAIVYLADGISYVWSNSGEDMDMLKTHRDMIRILLMEKRRPNS